MTTSRPSPTPYSRSVRRIVLYALAIAVALLVCGRQAPSAIAQTQTPGGPALTAALNHTDSALQQCGTVQMQAQQFQQRLQADVSKLQTLDTAATLTPQEQVELQLQITELQQQWTVVSTALQSLNSEYANVARNVGSTAAGATADGSDPSFDFNQMLSGLQKYANQVQQEIQQLQGAGPGGMTLGTMFRLQFRMQIMSQYVESVSNTLSAIHNEMLTMARAAEGQ